MSGGRARQYAWAATVGLVLADSSIVTLALPEILRQFDTTVFGVSWVLTAFNIVLAAALIPAARGLRRIDARIGWAAGLAVFAAASLLCALASSIGLLIAGRCLQALGGALVVAAAIELLAAARGSHRRGAAVWGTAGVAGLAIGPAAGGLLTELLSWEAIFALQVPVVLALPAALGPVPAPVERGPAGHLDLAPEVSLGLLSAGLTGALFLLVLLLIEGWRKSPLEAAIVVSVMPLATVAGRALARRLGHGDAVVAGGAILVAGGLAALGLLPDAGAAWTLAPQVLIGAGLALALPGLTERALSTSDPGGERAASTLAARHAGIVLGILLLTPIFSAELEDQHSAARLSGTALLLDAPLDRETKIEVASAVAERIERADGRLPDLGPAFEAVEPPPGARGDLARLERGLEEEVDKAATHAFSSSFLVAGGLALLSLVPIWLGRRRAAPFPGRRTMRVPLAATACCAAVVGPYLALGGASYRPLDVADPCDARPVEQLRRGDDVLQQLALSALDGAACSLRVTREELALALADPQARSRFLREQRISDEDFDRAARSALLRAIEDADRADRISPLVATLLRSAAERLPVGVVIDVLERASGRNAVDLLGDLFENAP